MEKTYSLDSLLEEFSLYLVEKKRRTEFTSREYITDLKILLPDKTYENYENLIGVIDKRINSLDDWSKDKPSTKNRRIFSTNAFLKFLEKTGRIEKASHYPCRRVERASLTPLTKEEFSKLMEVTPYDNFRNTRDRIVFSLMFYTGISVSEAANLEHKNFEVKNGKPYLNVGWGYYKRRMLKIPKQVVKEIKNYRKLYAEAAKTKALPSFEEGSFFKNKFGKKISTRSIRRKFEKWTKIAKIEADLRSLRYSYAKKQLDKGIKPEELANLMGIIKISAFTLERLLAKI